MQVELLQALSAVRDVELYVLTPCRDLWQRSSPAALSDPLAADWLLSVPGLEARFGRLGAEFQQLLEGTGESQLGQWQEGWIQGLQTGGANREPLAKGLRRWTLH